MALSVLELEILLFYSYPHPNRRSRGLFSAEDKAHIRLIAKGLLEDISPDVEEGEEDLPPEYRLTEKGKFHVESILSLPLPVTRPAFQYDLSDWTLVLKGGVNER